jgi:hypothetical protein
MDKLKKPTLNEMRVSEMKRLKITEDTNKKVNFYKHNMELIYGVRWQEMSSATLIKFLLRKVAELEVRIDNIEKE